MAQARPPSVARGFLFADLRDYSAWVERHGDRAASELLRIYRDLVRGAVAQFGGAEIRTEGDSFYVVFDSTSAAIECGLKILADASASQAAAGGPIPVGIGVHAGETVESDEGYVGSAVNIAARVCARAGAGELLVTETVRALTRTSLEVGFAPRGRHRLKGISEPVVLYRVEAGSRRIAPAGPRPVTLVAAAAAIIALVVGAGVIGAGMLQEQTAIDGGGVPSNGQPDAAMASASAAASQTPPDQFPSAAEAALLARVPDEVAGHCERAEDDEIPQHRPDFFNENRPAPRVPLFLYAGLRCPVGGSVSPSIVYYFHAPSEGDIGEAFSIRASDAASSPGDCSVGDAENVYGAWSLGDQDGRLLCTSRGGVARIVWTYDEQGILAEAVRNDGDLVALKRWWHDHRLLGAP